MEKKKRLEQHVKFVELSKEAENKFYNDLGDIWDANEKYLTDVFMKNEDSFEFYSCVFDMFFYEKMHTYSKEEAVKFGVFNGVDSFLRDVYKGLDNIEDIFDLEKSIYSKIELYMNKFEMPRFDENYAGKALFDEVMSLEESNIYKQKLWYALLYPLYEGLNDVECRQMISDVLVAYDFDYKLPHEKEYLAGESYRIKNHIPDFSRVKEGDTWTGTRRYANFIRALKLRYYKSGSNSRIAQIKSINRSCKWVDDEKTKTLTLIEIYPERLGVPISSRTRKYETLFKKVLLYHLIRNEGEFKTTVGTFWLNTYVLSRNYKKIKLSTYINELNIQDDKVDELKYNLNELHEIADRRLKKLFLTNLNYLEEKNIIRTSKKIFIVKDGNRVPVDEAKEIGLSPVDAEVMIDEAREYSFSQLYGYEFNSNTGKREKIQLKTFQDIMKFHKQREQKELYESYIQDNYGWEYTYEEITIRLHENLKDVEIPYKEYTDAKNALNDLLVTAVRNTIKNKNENLQTKYDEEEERISAIIQEYDDVRDVVELGLVDKNGVIKNKQFKYPDSIIKQSETFIETEMMI